MTSVAPLPQPGTPPKAPAPAAPITAPSRYLGRQPILDAQRRLFGYELFYRAGKVDHFSGDPDLATREVIDHWLLLIPDSARSASFVNCTRAALVDGLVTLLPSESTVLEILPNIEPDSEVIESCLALKKLGYRFALEGFFPQSSRAPFLRFADFIKIDFLSADFDLRRAIYAMAADSGASLLAEKIETDIQLRIAVSEGCTLFQGYFFSRCPCSSAPTPSPRTTSLTSSCLPHSIIPPPICARSIGGLDACFRLTMLAVAMAPMLVASVCIQVSVLAAEPLKELLPIWTTPLVGMYMAYQTLLLRPPASFCAIQLQVVNAAVKFRPEWKDRWEWRFGMVVLTGAKHPARFANPGFETQSNPAGWAFPP